MKPWIPVVAPKLLDFFEYFSPLGTGGDGKEGISNITLAPFIISWDPMDEGDEAHEGIHVLQQYECGLVGGLVAVPLAFLLGAPWWAALLIALGGFLPFIGWFYWIYLATWAYWSLTSRKALDDFSRLDPGKKGYYLIPFEREAYLYDQDGFSYFEDRKWFAWLRIADDELAREGAELSEKLFMAYRDEHFFANIITWRKDLDE